MKPITVALITFFTLCVTSHIIFQTHEARAEMSEALAASEAAVAVDVIVGIDSETRTITLKNEAGEEYTYTAGPEVKNFDQLERGDQVIMSYFSGFVFTLNPTGATGEQSVTDVAIATAKEGEKPGIAVSASKNVTAVVAEIDKPNRIVILQGPERLLALKVSDRIDLDTVEVGQEVEVLHRIIRHCGRTGAGGIRYHQYGKQDSRGGPRRLLGQRHPDHVRWHNPSVFGTRTERYRCRYHRGRGNRGGV